MSDKTYPTEAQEQKAIIAYFANSCVINYLIHIPNGGSRSSAFEGKNLKQMGVKPGVSDLFLACPQYTIEGSIKQCGLWIELKRHLGYYKTENAAYKAVTESQNEWIDQMRNLNYAAKVAYGAEQAIKFIHDYMSIPCPEIKTQSRN